MEKQLIVRSDAPRTRQSLAADLASLGVQAGEVLLVHSSLSSLGWVNGGPVAVIQALQDVLTPDGTLVMPAHSMDLTDPSEWVNPPIPESWWQEVRDTMPPFDPRTTTTRGMGRIAELFRTWPDVRRSNHPHSSFAAWGQHAEFITASHELNFSLGEGSPLARVYDLNGRVLLLGTDKNTSLHLAEVRAGRGEQTQVTAPMLVNGQQQWVSFDEWRYDDETFPPVKVAFETSGAVTIGKIGSATAKLMHQRELVDFAVKWWQESH